MMGGFFRERKYYRLHEISKELDTSPEKTRRLVGILKKYGIVKTVKSSKPEYEDLRRIARETGKSLAEIKEILTKDEE